MVVQLEADFSQQGNRIQLKRSPERLPEPFFFLGVGCHRTPKLSAQSDCPRIEACRECSFTNASFIVDPVDDFQSRLWTTFLSLFDLAEHLTIKKLF